MCRNITRDASQTQYASWTHPCSCVSVLEFGVHRHTNATSGCVCVCVCVCVLQDWALLMQTMAADDFWRPRTKPDTSAGNSAHEVRCAKVLWSPVIQFLARWLVSLQMYLGVPPAQKEYIDYHCFLCGLYVCVFYTHTHTHTHTSMHTRACALWDGAPRQDC